MNQIHTYEIVATLQVSGHVLMLQHWRDDDIESLHYSLMWRSIDPDTGDSTYECRWSDTNQNNERDAFRELLEAARLFIYDGVIISPK